jgi:hypothetical protein
MENPMKVIMVFEYPDIKDVQSPEADDVIEHLSAQCQEFEENFGCFVYVDDAYEDSHE